MTSTWLSSHRASWAQDRPWSRVAVYDVRHGDGAVGRVWFKANGIGTRRLAEPTGDRVTGPSALSRRAALIESPASVHRDYEFPVRGWLQELMAEPPPS